jgi:hypothetical protein
MATKKKMGRPRVAEKRIPRDVHTEPTKIMNIGEILPSDNIITPDMPPPQSNNIQPQQAYSMESSMVDDDPLLSGNVIERPGQKPQMPHGYQIDAVPSERVTNKLDDILKDELNQQNNTNQPPKQDFGQPFTPDFTVPGTGQQKKPKQPKDTPMNGEFDDMNKKEQKASATAMADLCIMAYVELHKLGYNMAKIDNGVLTKLSKKGKIQFSVLNTPVGDGATVLDVLKNYNKNLASICVVSEEFKETVRPLLIAVFMEKGIGLTPTQNLLLLVAMDLGVKVSLIFKMRKEAMSYVVSETDRVNGHKPPVDLVAPDYELKDDGATV